MALTEVRDQKLIAFMEGVTEGPRTDWEDCFEVLREDAPSLKLASMSGIGSVPVWDGSNDIDTTDINDRANVTIDYEKYALRVRLNKYDRKDVPGLEEGAARKLGFAVMNTMGAIAADRLADVYDITSTAGDGVELISNSHPLASGAVRDNRLASAFDRSAAMAAFALAGLWKSYHGQEEDFSGDEFKFFGSAEDATLYETFREVFGSSVSSSQMQVNAAQDFRVDPRGLIWQRLTNTGRWGIISKSRTPLVYWIREPAENTVDFVSSSRSMDMTVDFGIGTGIRPDPAGIIASRTD